LNLLFYEVSELFRNTIYVGHRAFCLECAVRNLLSYIPEFVHGCSYLLASGRLLLCGKGNFSCCLSRLINYLHQACERAVNLVNKSACFVDPLGSILSKHDCAVRRPTDLGYQISDLPGCIYSSFCKASYLFRNDCKSFAVLSGSG